MMTVFLFVLYALSLERSPTRAFVVHHGNKAFCGPRGRLPMALNSGGKEGAEKPVGESFAVGTFVEFDEKGREHVGKIESAEHKRNGSARYDVVDENGRHYGIAHKAVHYALPAPNNPPAAERLFQDFVSAHEATDKSLRKTLDISPELLEIAWEEVSTEDGDVGDSDHVLTPGKLVDLVHCHAASAIEKYMAWRLMRSDLSHVFFRELKHNGRVDSFKAKARKAVDAAKATFCSDHPEEDEFCFV